MPELPVNIEAETNSEPRVETANRITPSAELVKQLPSSVWHILLTREKMGDTIIGLPIFHALREVKKITKNPHGIHLYTSDTNKEILQPFAALPEVAGVHELTWGGRGEQDAQVTAVNMPESKHILFDLADTWLQDENDPHSLYKPRYPEFQISPADKPEIKVDIMRTDNIFQYLIWSYSSDLYHAARNTAFTEDLTGLPRGTLNIENAQPRLILPTNSEERKQFLAQQSGINTDQPYVMLIPQTGKTILQYPLRLWAVIAQDLIQKGYQVSILADEKPRARGYTFGDIKDAMEDASLENKVHYTSGSLLDIASFAKDASFFISSDTGPAHLLLAIPNGPKGSTLHLDDSFLLAKYWRSSWEKQLPFQSNSLWEINPNTVVAKTIDFAKK